MPTAEQTATPPKRETWADWFPDEEPTLTIDDVMDRLQERGIDDVTVENIRLWQHQRVLPAPIRRQVGTGKGGIRALYPPQAVNAIAGIRPLQRHGIPLRKINAHLARLFGLNKGPITHPLSAHVEGTSSMSGELSITATPGNLTLSGMPAEFNATGLEEAIRTEAVRQGQRMGALIREVDVTFTDTHGRKHSRVFTLDRN